MVHAAVLFDYGGGRTRSVDRLVSTEQSVMLIFALGASTWDVHKIFGFFTPTPLVTQPPVLRTLLDDPSPPPDAYILYGRPLTEKAAGVPGCECAVHARKGNCCMWPV